MKRRVRRSSLPGCWSLQATLQAFVWLRRRIDTRQEFSVCFETDREDRTVQERVLSGRTIDLLLQIRLIANIQASRLRHNASRR